MLRNALLWASTNPFMAEKLPSYGFVKRATRRFLPGETLDEALAEAENLRSEGFPTTVTLLGENVTTAGEADAVTDLYAQALESVRSRGLDTEVSVKLTQLGLDHGAFATQQRVDRLIRSCDPSSTVWIDMEGSDYVEDTLDVFRGVRESHQNVGLCLQAYLFRTKVDLETLMPLEPSIRLVKGAYKEPAEIAYARKADVDQNFRRLTSKLLQARARGMAGRPVIGTHDAQMVAEANRMAHELGLSKADYEIAMLYGIQTAEQQRLVRTGHSLRVLLSYGDAWFPWYMRRLAERPANVWFVLKQIIR